MRRQSKFAVRAARSILFAAVGVGFAIAPVAAQQEELQQLDNYLTPPRPQPVYRPPAQPARPAYRAPVQQPVRSTYQPPRRAVQPVYRPPAARPVPQVVPLKPPVQIAYDTHSPGTLGFGDGYESGYFKELYAFEGQAGEPIIVNLIGSNDARMQLDPFIRLIGPNGDVVAEDDNSGRDAERGDARIQTKLPETGTYQILVTTAKAYDRGRYTIGLILDN